MKAPEILKKYIAVLLVGIFIIPIGYQAIHVTWHHSADHGCEHHCHSAVETGKPSVSGLLLGSQNEEDCPVCVYQFAIVDLPEEPLYCTFTSVIESTLNDLEIHPAFSQVQSTRSPRAPPALNS